MPLRLKILAAVFLLPASAPAQELICPQVGAGESAPLAEPGDDRVLVSADQAEITQQGLSTLAGTVRLIQGDNRFDAQALSYDKQSRRVQIQAESLFRNRDLLVRSREADFDLVNNSGVFLGTEFTLINRGARGAAERIELSRTGPIRIEDVYYTTCAPGSRAWFLEASDIELDREKGLGTARHARLRFGYVPILYSPWFQFPIDDRRSSGFLFPTVGNSDNTGVDMQVPYYLNLAPNYDAQITPRYMSERGTQLATQGRYLLRNHTGRLSYDYLDRDEKLGRERAYGAFEHQGLLNRRLALDARYGEVSDEGYFEDLAGKLDASSVTHLERSAQLTYASPAAYTITARVSDYQTVSTNVLPADEPYQRLPQIRIDALTRKALWNSRLGFAGEYVNFSRDIDVITNGIPEPRQGQRLDLNPYLRFLHDRNAWYLSSQLDWRQTQYKVTDASASDRGLPMFSAEGGLRFERRTGSGELQTLEPQLYYLYVPYRDQDRLPRFDVGEPDFDFVQLFARNRFSGEDRIADANHLAAALTSRLINPADGRQHLSVSLGQIYRFETPRVSVAGPGFTRVDSGGTDYIGEFDYRPLARLSLLSNVQWSPDKGQFMRTSAAVRYRGDSVRADLSYRYRNGFFATLTPPADLEQTDASLAAPLIGGWSVLGRWRYSAEENRTLEAVGGLEYQTCCWAVRSAYRRYQFNTQQEYATGVYLQLELTGLSRIGTGFQSLLPSLE